MDSSYPYSPPTLPGREVLTDMIVWYATLEIRRELWDPDSDLLTELADEVTQMVATWRPTTELHYSYTRSGRTLEWMVWSTVSSRDEPMAAIYANPDDCLEPWGIKIETLPRYGYGPSWVGKPPEGPPPPDPRVIVLSIEDSMPDTDDLDGL